MVGPPGRLPSAAGRLLAHEVQALSRLVDSPPRPFVAVVGGAKLADKLGVLSVLADQVDVLVVGGGMCFTFLAALGHDVGASVVDLDHLDRCRGLLDAGVRIVLPDDVLALAPGGVLDHEGGTGEVRRFGCDLPEGWRGLDIGPHSIEAFAHVIAG